MSLSRRELLGGAVALGAAALAPRRAAAFGDVTLVDVAELDLGLGTVSRPGAWKQLLYEMTQSTSVECRPGSVRVKPEDPALFEHPFAVLVGDGAFAQPSDEAIEQLSQYLAYGGFLFVDDDSFAVADEIDEQVRVSRGGADHAGLRGAVEARDGDERQRHRLIRLGFQALSDRADCGAIRRIDEDEMTEQG